MLHQAVGTLLHLSHQAYNVKVTSSYPRKEVMGELPILTFTKEDNEEKLGQLFFIFCKV